MNTVRIETEIADRPLNRRFKNSSGRQHAVISIVHGLDLDMKYAAIMKGGDEVTGGAF